MFAVPASLASAQPAGDDKGTRVVGGYATERTVDQIMRTAPKPDPLDFLKGVVKSTELMVDRRHLPMAPGAIHASQWPPATADGNNGGLRGGGRFSPQTIGIQWDGDVYGNLTPSDAYGAVGPTQVLVTTNHSVTVFDKTGAVGALNTTLDNFFTSVRNGTGTADPMCTFDRLTNRWFVLAINVASTANRTVLAVSDGPTISGVTVWRYFFLTAPTGVFDDYPGMGVDANGVYVGYNVFTGATGTQAWVIQKSSVLATGPIVATRFNFGATSSTPFSPRGVDNDDPAPPNGYFVGVSWTAFGQMVVRKVTWSSGVPTMGAGLIVNVLSEASPITPVPTNGISIDQIDDRAFQAQMHLNRKTGARTCFTAYHSLGTNGGVGGSGDRNIARWIQLDLAPALPTMLQAGTSYASGTIDHYSFPSCVQTGQGHMAMGFTMAQAANFVRTGASGRLTGDASGTTQPLTVAYTATQAYNVFANRWGDYSMTKVDPADDQTVWTIQHQSAGSSWKVRVIKLIAPPPSAIASVTPNTLIQGNTYNLAVAGTAANGSEFYDTDAGYPNRLAAAFSGSGLTVNSITFSHANPQTFTANVTVGGAATLGNRTLTVTNPDGQAVNLANAVTVTAGNPPVTLTPVSFKVNQGQVSSGNNASLAADDANPLLLCRGYTDNASAYRITFDANFQSPYLTASAIHLDLKSRMTVAGSYKVRAYIADRVTGGAGTYTYGFANQVVPDSVIGQVFGTFSGDSTNVAKNIHSDGTIRARVEIVFPNFGGHPAPCSEFEYLNVTVTP